MTISTSGILASSLSLLLIASVPAEAASEDVNCPAKEDILKRLAETPGYQPQLDRGNG